MQPKENLHPVCPSCNVFRKEFHMREYTLYMEDFTGASSWMNCAHWSRGYAAPARLGRWQRMRFETFRPTERVCAMQQSDSVVFNRLFNTLRPRHDCEVCKLKTSADGVRICRLKKPEPQHGDDCPTREKWK